MKELFLTASLTCLSLVMPASAQIASFQHVILVIQENRTPDNLFHGLCPTTNASACSSSNPGPAQYNIQTAGWLDNTSPSGTTNPHMNPLGLGYDISHKHSAFVAMCDFNNVGACKMDGAAQAVCMPHAQTCPAKMAYGFVNPSEVQPYLDLVHDYGWANYMSQTNQGPSYPAHQFLFGATSAPTATDDHNGIFAAENTAIAGCAAPMTSRVLLINPAGDEFKRIFPCFEHQTVADLLDSRNISWRYYSSNTTPDGLTVSTASGIWVAPNSIGHICNAASGKCTGTEWTSHLEFKTSAVLSDISNCKLRGVSWVIPDAVDSDHSYAVNFTGGPSWVTSIVNAVGQSTCKNSDGSSYWNSTAIIITWDDWGGWYDHEPPMIELGAQGGYQMGFRVPLIVVSAYTPARTISNYREDFGSVIRFVEHNFDLMEGELTFADARSSRDLSEFFRLGDPPRRFKVIKAPKTAKDFLTRKPSGLPVDDD